MPECVEQRLLIPETNVVDRPPVRFDVGGGQSRAAGKLAFFDVVQTESRPRRADVMLNKRRFLRQFVRRDGKSLHERGISPARRRRQNEQGPARQKQTVVLTKDTNDGADCRQDRRRDLRPEQRQQRVHVREIRAEKSRLQSYRQMPDAQKNFPGDEQQNRRRQREQMSATLARKREIHQFLSLRIDFVVYPRQINRRRADYIDEQEHQQQNRNRVERGQRENVKSDVAPENRISRAERNLVEKAQKRLAQTPARKSPQQPGDDSGGQRRVTERS